MGKDTVSNKTYVQRSRSTLPLILGASIVFFLVADYALFWTAWFFAGAAIGTGLYLLIRTLPTMAAVLVTAAVAVVALAAMHAPQAKALLDPVATKSIICGASAAFWVVLPVGQYRLERLARRLDEKASANGAEPGSDKRGV